MSNKSLGVDGLGLGWYEVGMNGMDPNWFGINPNILSFYPNLIPTERCSTILPQCADVSQRKIVFPAEVLITFNAQSAGVAKWAYEVKFKRTKWREKDPRAQFWKWVNKIHLLRVFWKMCHSKLWTWHKRSSRKNWREGKGRSRKKIRFFSRTLS